MSVRVRLKGTAELRRAVQAAGEKARMLTAQALYLEGERVMADSKQEAPVGVDGVLRASGFVRPPSLTSDRIRVVLGYGGAASAYAAGVHEGTRPHFPPVDALKPWAKKKLGDEDLAFVVARSIARKGTKPTKYLERPLRKHARGMGQRIARHIRAGLGG